jgi:hypothetical protein
MNRTIDKDVCERWCHWMVIQGCAYGFDRVLGIKEFLETPSKQYSKGTLYDEWVWKYPQGKVKRQSKPIIGHTVSKASSGLNLYGAGRFVIII